MRVQGGWLDTARQCPSPNYNARPDSTDISLLIIHSISLPPGQYGSDCIERFFCNRLDCDAHPWFEQLRGRRVSAHLLIDRRGAPTQFVPFESRAWHAGASSFCGRDNCNDFSIGIELEGTDAAAYTDAQYVCLAEVTRALLDAYPLLKPDRICGHSDIAPGRKTDPGTAFDWLRYRDSIRE